MSSDGSKNLRARIKQLEEQLQSEKMMRSFEKNAHALIVKAFTADIRKWQEHIGEAWTELINEQYESQQAAWERSEYD